MNSYLWLAVAASLTAAAAGFGIVNIILTERYDKLPDRVMVLIIALIIAYGFATLGGWQP